MDFGFLELKGNQDREENSKKDDGWGVSLSTYQSDGPSALIYNTHKTLINAQLIQLIRQQANWSVMNSSFAYTILPVLK